MPGHHFQQRLRGVTGSQGADFRLGSVRGDPSMLAGSLRHRDGDVLAVQISRLVEAGIPLLGYPFDAEEIHGAGERDGKGALHGRESGSSREVNLTRLKPCHKRGPGELLEDAFHVEFVTNISDRLYEDAAELVR